MCNKESFDIDLKALAQGVTTLTYELDDNYFKVIEAPGVERGELKCSLAVARTDDYFEFSFHVEGLVHIPCDVCLEDMEQPIVTEGRLAVKFGDEYREDDDLVTVAENEGILNVAWYIYELIELDIPIRHVHAPGKCNAAMVELLEEHSAARSGEEDGEASIDPRWEALRKLKE